MTEALTIAYINLIAKLGLDLAITVIEALSTSSTNDEAIAALRKASTKTAADYLAEAQARKDALNPPSP